MDDQQQRWWTQSAEDRAFDRRQWLQNGPGARESALMRALFRKRWHTRFGPATFTNMIQVTARDREMERRLTIAVLDAFMKLLARQALLLHWRGHTAVGVPSSHRTAREWEELATVTLRLHYFERATERYSGHIRNRYLFMMQRVDFHRRMSRTDERVHKLRNVLWKTKLSAAGDGGVIEGILHLVKMDSDLQVDARYRDGDGATQSRVHAEGHVARLRQSLAADITRALEASEMRMHRNTLPMTTG